MVEPVITHTVDVTDLSRLAGASSKMKTFTRRRFKAGMDESGMLVTSLVAARTPVNYGLLRAGITYPEGYKLQGRGNLDQYRGVIGASGVKGQGAVASDYVLYVEEGTKPHWAPIAPLKLYALRKWGNERLGYALQRVIAGSALGGTGPGGTKGAHMFKRGWEEGGARGVQRIFRQVAIDVSQEFRRLAK